MVSTSRRKTRHLLSCERRKYGGITSACKIVISVVMEPFSPQRRKEISYGNIEVLLSRESDLGLLDSDLPVRNREKSKQRKETRVRDHQGQKPLSGLNSEPYARLLLSHSTYPLSLAPLHSFCRSRQGPPRLAQASTTPGELEEALISEIPIPRSGP